MRYGNYDDSDCDSVTVTSALDFNDSQAIIVEAELDCDVQITDDEADPQAVNVATPQCPLRHVARRSGSIDIDESEEDQESSKTF